MKRVANSRRPSALSVRRAFTTRIYCVSDVGRFDVTDDKIRNAGAMRPAVRGHIIRAMLSRRAFLTAAAVAPLTRASRLHAARYDLLIKGGRVIDPGERVDRIGDVAVLGGRIAAVQPNIAVDQAAQVVDARGKLVTPGLIDLHVHVGAPELTPAALLHDGVTSLVDAGRPAPTRSSR